MTSTLGKLKSFMGDNSKINIDFTENEIAITDLLNKYKVFTEETKKCAEDYNQLVSEIESASVSLGLKEKQFADIEHLNNHWMLSI